MSKTFKIVLVCIACIFVLGLLGGIIAFVFTGNTANADEYKLGSDTIKSIKAVVEKRQVTSVSTEIKNGVSTKEIEYKSNNVQDDLMKYVQYLRNDGGFSLTKEMNLYESPSSVELCKESNDTGKIIMMTIDYNSFGYTITIRKGEGTLTMY